MQDKHCKTKKFDWFFWGALITVTILYGFDFLPIEFGPLLQLSKATAQIVNTVWWGIALGILMIVLLSLIPKEIILSLFGSQYKFKGLIRATLAGILLDLCSHGILMIGAKLYERGVSTGQVIAFLIASPWNSLSTTIILIALIGMPWTLVFIVLSMIIGILTGYLFDFMVEKSIIPANPNQLNTEPLPMKAALTQYLNLKSYTKQQLSSVIWRALKESKMIIRWLLFGIILAAVIRAYVEGAFLQHYFGPTALGLVLTLVAATIIEICSEGSAPIAAELITRANAPGNCFTFLMAGVSTDVTELLVLRETTRRWIVPIMLPLVTVPQIIIVAIVLNKMG